MLFKTIDLSDKESIKALFFGDTHGCLNYVEQSLALLAAGSDSMKFATGDFTDRGESSYLLSQRFRLDDSYESVRGNHEDMIRDEIGISKSRMLALRSINGGDWRNQLTDMMVEDLVSYYDSLPLVIEILLPNNKKIGIVHANVPKGLSWEQLKSELSKPREDVCDKLIHHLLWERKSVHANEDYWIDGVDAVLCGHNIQEYGFKTLGNRVFIDTGTNLMVPGSDRFRMTVLELTDNGSICGLLEAHELYLNEYNKLDYL